MQFTLADAAFFSGVIGNERRTRLVAGVALHWRMQFLGLGADTVVIGPGNMDFAHRRGEFVPVDELDHCTAILSTTIRQICG